MFQALYTAGLCLYALGALPRFLLRPKGRSFMSWFGRGAPRQVRGRPVVWVHAVSMGEMRAVAGLVCRLRRLWPQASMLVSTTTATGNEEARRSLGDVDHIFYLPLDLPWIVRPLVRRLSPDLVILSETDLWLHLLQESKRCGAHIHLVNAKVSARTARRWSRLPRLCARLYGVLDGVCVQDLEYRDRFLALGVAPERIHVTGNLKFDAVRQTTCDIGAVRRRLRIGELDRVIVLGSTHDPEERVLMDQLIDGGDAKILVVPRHPERFEVVAKEIAALGVLWGRWSLPEELTGGERVILVDAMGVLNTCYGVASVAIVGGSFTGQVGGHNIIEPVLQGIPVFFGPYMHAQEAMCKVVLETCAGRQLDLKDVHKVVRRFLEDTNAQLEMIAGGREALTRMQGSLERTWKTLPLKRIGLNVRMGAQMTRGGAEVSSLGS